jgi:hypothetical protein
MTLYSLRLQLFSEILVGIPLDNCILSVVSFFTTYKTSSGNMDTATLCYLQGLQKESRICLVVNQQCSFLF